ncbi:helix-turn-helix domain-containing protein [Chryseobacterium arthrosphaerae]|uniref:Helix-turn-helix domain-containing protein n=2 Tax=Chryseobacterium arthrosphaerae TaxID=651561 RepID=A0ABU7R0N6_9FLAO|nr:helix-turn-helix domain-containing protein [Chryseobacterium arthrosphaerae]MDG4655092.1 helix-turn-helix domain-containing protein [Chryseobacterium arthrosphaerae]
MMEKNVNPQKEADPYPHDLLALFAEILNVLQKKEPDHFPFYDSADVKRLLNISDSTLHRIRKSEKIPYVKIGNKIFYPKSFFNNAFKS